MAKVICAFGLREAVEDLRDGLEDARFGSRCGFAQQRLEFGEDHLDGVEVRRVGRQEEEPRTSFADRGADSMALVAAQIIDDHDVAGLQRGHQRLFDIGQELDRVNRSVEQHGRVDAVITQRRQEGERAPFAEGSLGDEAFASGRPTPRSRHVGLRPSLVDEDQASWIEPALIALPAIPFAGYVRSVLFGGVEAFF